MIGKFIVAIWILGELYVHYKFWGRRREDVMPQERYIGTSSLFGAMLGYILIALGVLYW
jgi:hypothetical protein